MARGWFGESGRHAKAARGIKTVRIRKDTRTGVKTLKRLQLLADMLWFNKGLLGPESVKDIHGEMVEIQKEIGEYHWDSGGQLRRVRPGQRGLFMAPKTKPFDHGLSREELLRKLRATDEMLDRQYDEYAAIGELAGNLPSFVKEKIERAGLRKSPSSLTIPELQKIFGLSLEDTRVVKIAFAMIKKGQREEARDIIRLHTLEPRKW